MIKKQKCSQFIGTVEEDTYKECQNEAQFHHIILEGNLESLAYKGYYMDFCEEHNDIKKSGTSLKCWRCGDK